MKTPIGTDQKRAETLKAGLQTALSKRRQTVVSNLVLVVEAMIKAQTPNTMELASGLPVPTEPSVSRAPGLRRLLEQPLLDSPVVLEPFFADGAARVRLLRSNSHVGGIKLIGVTASWS